MRTEPSCYDLYVKFVKGFLHCLYDSLLSPNMIPGSLPDETGSLRSGVELTN